MLPSWFLMKNIFVNNASRMLSKRFCGMIVDDKAQKELGVIKNVHVKFSSIY